MPFHKAACIFLVGFSGGKKWKNDINSQNLEFMSFNLFCFVWIFSDFFVHGLGL